MLRCLGCLAFHRAYISVPVAIVVRQDKNSDDRQSIGFLIKLDIDYDGLSG